MKGNLKSIEAHDQTNDANDQMKMIMFVMK